LLSWFADYKKSTCCPYVEKLVVKPDTQLLQVGDLHGDVRSLNAIILEWQAKGYMDEHNPFKIRDDKKDSCFIQFLGDYTDRGWYGIEVMSLVLYLKYLNPDNVILVRGNHEDIAQNNKESCNSFAVELADNYGLYDDENHREKFFDKIQRVYESLPVALYSGTKDPNTNITNYALCCHGGMDFGFDPTNLFNHKENRSATRIIELKRGTMLQKLFELNNNLFNEDKIETTLTDNDRQDFVPTGMKTMLFQKREDGTDTATEIGSARIGFSWFDYDAADTPNYAFKSTSRRDITVSRIGQASLLQLFNTDKHKIWGTFRAHQHTTDPEDIFMQKIKEYYGIAPLWIDKSKETEGPSRKFQLWDNFVLTYNVTPLTPYQDAGFNYATYGIVTTAEKFDDWNVETCNIEMFGN
jgi:hypothetical protein